MTPVAELVGVHRRFEGAPPVDALRPTDLVIRSGDHVALTGRSGSGKSTLLHLIGLLDRPTGGRLLLDGADTTALGDAARSALRGRRIGFVFQAFHLLPHRSALENVALALLYQGTDRRGRVERATEALESVGLAHRLHAMPTTLSGGEQQRVAIARAIVTNPSLLLADEPTGNLDSATAEAVLAVVDRLNAEGGLTVVVATHDPNVAAHATHRLELRDGRLHQATVQA